MISIEQLLLHIHVGQREKGNEGDTHIEQTLPE